MLIEAKPVPEKFLACRRQIPLGCDEPLTFLDIETTGLNRRRDPIMLIGLMILTDSGGMLHQFFARSPAEEHQLLDALQRHLPETGLLVTFNGQSFDIPYLNQRYEVHGLTTRLLTERNLDLLHWARKAMPHLPNHRLKSIETQLGIHRADTLSGADCVSDYAAYLRTQDPALAQKICLHNYEDILHMAPLLALYPLLPEDSPHRQLPFPLTLEGTRFWCRGPAQLRGQISLEASAQMPVPHRQDRHVGGATLTVAGRSLSAALPVVAFPYPEPDSLYMDCDRVPGFRPVPFNGLPTTDKLALMVRRGGQWLPKALEALLGQLLEI